MELSRLLAALQRPEAYPHPAEDIRLIQTHSACVLLAGAFAYKLKKPVDFGFLDYSTLRRRERFCRKEVALNERLARGLYLGVVPIVVTRGGLRVGTVAERPEGEVIEWAVQMHRLPEDRMLPGMLARGTATRAQLERVARRMAAFHRTAPHGPSVARLGEPAELERAWIESFEQTAPFVGLTHTRAQRRLVEEYVQASLSRRDRLFLERARRGFIRDGHGDLRTSSIAFSERCADGLCIFDCIEFNRRVRCCDVASELAFLAMDLELHGQPALATAAVDAYVEASGDPHLRELLPFYGCHRAFVRGKVEGFRLRDAEVDVHERHEALVLSRMAFALACRFAERDRPPLLIMMSGLSATGKTTLAQGIAQARGWEHLSSDVVRREGGPWTAPGEGLYSEARKEQVYDALLQRAARAVRQGRSVVVDATFGERRRRDRLRQLAFDEGAYLFAVECLADEDAVRERMADRDRHGSVSDARLDTWRQQQRTFEPLDELDGWNHLQVQTDEPVAWTVRFVLAALEERLRPEPEVRTMGTEEVEHAPM